MGNSVNMSSKKLETLCWIGGVDGHLRLIDQTLLPVEFKEIDCRDAAAVWEAIKMLRIRGAPAIGIAAAYGVCIGLQKRARTPTSRPFSAGWLRWSSTSPPAGPRPSTSFGRSNAWKPRPRAESLRGRPTGEIAELLLNEAKLIHEEDRLMCRAIGRHGAELLRDGQGVLTHCNAGGLATADYGTALAVFFSAAESGKTLARFCR